jgi:hypothetical protein
MGKNAEGQSTKPMKGQTPKPRGKLGPERVRVGPVKGVQHVPTRERVRVRPVKGAHDVRQEFVRMEVELGQESPKRGKKPRRGRPEVPRNKVSIAIAPEDLAWAIDTARMLGVSVSSLFTDGLELYRRKYNLGKLLEVLWPDEPPLTDEDRQAVRDEWASVGFKP